MFYHPWLAPEASKLIFQSKKVRNLAYFRSAEAKKKLLYDARRLLAQEGFKKYPILTLLFINSALYENNVQFAEAYCVFKFLTFLIELEIGRVMTF